MALLVKNLLFTLIIPGTVAVYVPLWMARDWPVATGVAGMVALALLILGGSIYVWCVWDFATFGRGTPAPVDAPKRLVVRGLYRYTRNPMYLGVLTVLLGWTVLFQQGQLGIYSFVVGCGFHLFVVVYEEPHLRSIFGKEYEEYCTRVGRWLPWPRRPCS